MKLLTILTCLLCCSMAIAEPRVKILEAQGIVVRFNVEQDKAGNFVKSGEVEGMYSDLSPAIKGSMLNDKYVGKLTQWWSNGKVMVQQETNTQGDLLSYASYDNQGTKISEITSPPYACMKMYNGDELLISLPVSSVGKVYIKNVDQFDLEMTFDEKGIKKDSEVILQYHEDGRSMRHFAKAIYKDDAFLWSEITGFKIEPDKICLVTSDDTYCGYPILPKLMSDLILKAIEKVVQFPVEFRF